MKFVVIGVHLHREQIEPIAAALPCAPGDSLWLSAVEVADDQPLGDRDLLLRVAKTRAELLDRATFIAVRYGFAAHSAAEAAGKCPAHVDRWRALLELHAGAVEMTLKVAAENPMPRPVRADFSSGAEYLKALHAAASGVNIDAAFRTAADRAIAPLASSMRWINRDGASVELAALVPRERVDHVRAAGEVLKRDFPHVPFLLSGPWPLEVFADADHE